MDRESIMRAALCGKSEAEREELMSILVEKAAEPSPEAGGMSFAQMQERAMAGLDATGRAEFRRAAAEHDAEVLRARLLELG